MKGVERDTQQEPGVASYGGHIIVWGVRLRNRPAAFGEFFIGASEHQRVR